MKPPQIARDQLPYSPEPPGEFLVVFIQLDLNTCTASDSTFSRKTEQIRDQSIADSREREFFNQSSCLPEPMPQYSNHFHGDARMGQAEASKIFTPESK